MLWIIIKYELSCSTFFTFYSATLTFYSDHNVYRCAGATKRDIYHIKNITMLEVDLLAVALNTYKCSRDYKWHVQTTVINSYD